MSLDGHTVLVTGAGAGVGRGIAMALAADGAHVVVASRSDTGVADEISARGQAALWARCDVTAPDEVVDAVAVAVAATGRLDAIVHNATSNRSSQPHRLEEVDRALWEEHVSVSVRGARHCAAAAFAALKRHGGTFLVMTSPAGIEGSATLPLYATMKGALRGFAKSLARDWAPHGITVNVVSPLAYSPAMTAAIEAEPAMEERLSRRVPLGRIGDPERDIGSAVAFLVGPAARYVTGQTLAVDGGHFMNL
ncbi:SDR family NAD(P)-dependent oxidoreductase [Mycobacterium sp. 852002-10029_SCH5224772]|uniref:SDR family NAD(P)-dependent oxidoreductase n=1 Tax=Mycobacterium sp. 852002-10029_SCH5224772 TaxID=1834083 RepID=UPI000801A800|nr:SDR family oxidoreductase [Mycobacterium sp. 852002-10029_SCH5224772]OBF11139.1 short-chain dehydrogenase [Mycobacterium sp. 852002-10029_SCH5224772]